MSVSYHCTLCGEEAGAVEVLICDAAREWDIVLRGIVGVTHLWAKRESIPAIVQALVAGAATAYRHDPEWASFYCPQCDRSYCARHWQTETRFDDDATFRAWYDYTYGTCPEGHRRIVDD